MANETPGKCKSKGCYNPVLDGKYCEHCKQKRKEKRDKILAGAGVGGSAILGVAVAIKKGVLKQAPKIITKGIEVILRK